MKSMIRIGAATGAALALLFAPGTFAGEDASRPAHECMKSSDGCSSCMARHSRRASKAEQDRRDERQSERESSRFEAPEFTDRG